MITFLPTNYKFFDQFNRAADVVVRAAEKLLDNIEQNWPNQQCAESIKQLENEADNVAHETMEMLHKSFITPLERGDIRRLIFAIDNVIDLINDAARWISLYELTAILPDVKHLAKILVQATQAVRQAVSELPTLRKQNRILQACIEINRLENEGDQITHAAVAALFKSGMDALLVIKWREVIEYIEDAIDCCEDCANALEGIVQENS